MNSSKKLWFLSFPYLIGVLCGLIVLLTHPLVLKPLYNWKVDTSHPEDALCLIQALSETTPVGDLNAQLHTPLTLEEQTFFETLRGFLKNLSSWSIGLLVFALVMLLLDRNTSWRQLHNRTSFLISGLLITLGLVAFLQFGSLSTFYLDWNAVMQGINSLLIHIAPDAHLRTLYPLAFWNTLLIVFLSCLLFLFVLVPLLRSSSGKASGA